MNTWIKHPVLLSGSTLELRPIEKYHLPELELLAKDKRIWEFYAYDASNPVTFSEVFEASLLERSKGIQYPFIIYHKTNREIIGSTRFLDIQPRHKKLEIGATWLQHAYWGTHINPECKLLLLSYSFETLGAIRVQLKTDENNLRSRKAIEKTGGYFEGVFRNDMLRENNTKRNSAYYSFTDDEWAVKKNILEQLYYNRLEKF